MEWKKYFSNRGARRRTLYCSCAIAVGLTLALGIPSRSNHRETVADIKPESVDESDVVGFEMGRWLLREGYKRLMRMDHKAAADAAKLAAFFGVVTESQDLLNAAQAENLRLVSLMETEAKDAADAGDELRRSRAESVVERISSPVDDARGHLRAGNFVQARASLMEALENPAEKGEAQRLLEKMEKQNDGISAQDDTYAENIFKEGLKLKELGDLIGARIKFDSAMQLIRSAAAVPTFAGALEDAREDTEEKLKREYLPRLPILKNEAEEISLLPVPKRAAALLKLREEIKIVTTALPSEDRAIAFEKQVAAEIKKTAENWTSAALRAEGLSGCVGAFPMYELISRTFGDTDGVSISSAKEGMERCGGGR